MTTSVAFALFLAPLGMNSDVQPTPDGVRIKLPTYTLALKVRTPNSIRVLASQDPSFFDRQTFVELPSSGKTPFTVRNIGSNLLLTTSRLIAKVDLGSGRVTFTDRGGKPILAEDRRELEPAKVQEAATYHVRQEWLPNRDESLYGLGQHPWGPFDLKGLDFDLWQRNSSVFVPFLVSNQGYGIYWENSSFSKFGDLRRPEDIPAEDLLDANEKPGGLTASVYAGKDFNRLVTTRTDSKIDYLNPLGGSDGLGYPGLSKAPTSQTGRGNSALSPDLPRGDVSARWEGFILPPETGDYLFDSYSNGGIKVYVGDRLMVDHWRQSWLPEKDLAKVHLERGQKTKIKVEWVKDQGADTMVFRWKTPTQDPDTSLWSEVGGGVDYTFVYGPNLNQVVAGYREITGQATMPPKWAMGLWQSRQRYETQDQSLDVVREFRKRKIPFDNIVQDWFYWRRDEWGCHEFDPERFPNPDAWIDGIHKLHANLMISVWGKFYPGTPNFDEMHDLGYLYQPNLDEGRKDWLGYPFTFFDAFNPGARDLFWKQINRTLFNKGIDAWWMDATEPDLMAIPNLEGHRARMIPTAAGTPSSVINTYALRTAQAIYEGQRKAEPDQRVFNLTRSGFAGQQRFGATTWSGDITSTWTALKRQIPAGLGFTLSGIPYWTMDSGGFSVPSRFASRNPKPEDLDEWRELNTRWFEFAAFVPIFRVHGEFPYREMWQFGGDSSPSYRAMLKFDRIRYRLLPYIYSLAGAARLDGSAIMRPLVMDYPNDADARKIDDQYLFGPCLLVNPVVGYKERIRPVLLPPGQWYDFWSGRHVKGGQTVVAKADYDQIPIYVKAGSILPSGPELQYTIEKPSDPLTLTVYRGVDGSFSLYEDDGITNAYEKGQFARIPISWSEATKTLTIGKRMGSFKGMLTNRTFNVRFLDMARAVPFRFEPRPDVVVSYSGSPITVKPASELTKRS